MSDKKHDPIPERTGYDVAALETSDGRHVGYVSILPVSRGLEYQVILVGARFFRFVERPNDPSVPLRYAEIHVWCSPSGIRDTVVDDGISDLVR